MTRAGRNSGGVYLYVRNDIKYKLRPENVELTQILNRTLLKYIVNDKSRNIIMGVIYRAHTSIDCFNADIDNILQILTKENKNYHLVGDFNID